MDQRPTPPAPMLVLWVLWAGFLGGVVTFHSFLVPSAQNVSRDVSSIWPIALLPVLISIGVRWAVIPRMSNVQTLLPVMIFGIAMAESVTFLGVFLFPSHHWELFVASFLGILQFAPIFAPRLLAGPDPDALRSVE